MTSVERQLTSLCAQIVKRIWTSPMTGECHCTYPGCDVSGETIHTAHLMSKGAEHHWRWAICNMLPLCSVHHDWFDGRAGSKKQEEARAAIEKAHKPLFDACADLKRMRPELWTQKRLKEKMECYKDMLEGMG